ncbi:hypothetical protein DVH05_024044 [Phytophthora capsici]|nr:hypothetical protein DVH05_024044 [Phytophthora capsici]
MANIAAQQGHLDILQWLSEFHADRMYWDNVLGYAAAGGHLPAVKWLHIHRQDKCSTKAMNSAAYHGHLDVVKWLHHNRTEGCTTKAMDGAAARGHLDMVKWLHANRTEGCTDKAMTWAAQNGHLDVVKWLYEIGEDCERYTMDYVTDFNVMKWLHENTPDRLCSTTAIDNWAELGRLDLVMWLYENRTEGYSTHAIEMAARKGHLDVHGSHSLYSVRYESLYDFTVKMARMNGQQHVIEWVESLGEPETANKWC